MKVSATQTVSYLSSRVPQISTASTRFGSELASKGSTDVSSVLENRGKHLFGRSRCCIESAPIVVKRQWILTNFDRTSSLRSSTSKQPSSLQTIASNQWRSDFLQAHLLSA